MGVKGLWKLLEPAGRHVTLESLENKILAVDASILLNQSLKGMRDIDGSLVPNAHLVGLFHRLCKLLFYRIKPVFVFDGGVPTLKKKTMDARRERKKKASTVSSKTAERIVKNFLKGKAIEAVTGMKSELTLRSKSPREPDIFELTSIPQDVNPIESGSEEETDVVNLAQQQQLSQQWLEAVYQNPNEVNVESEDFKSLPAELQHELIVEMKEERKWAPTREMPQEAGNFSSFQLQNVLKRGKLNQRLEELRKDMNNRNTGEVVGMTSQNSLQGDVTVESRRIISEDTGHYILIKGSSGKERSTKEAEMMQEFSGEGGFFKESQQHEKCSFRSTCSGYSDNQQQLIKVSEEIHDSNPMVSPQIKPPQIQPQKEFHSTVSRDDEESYSEYSTSDLEIDMQVEDVLVEKELLEKDFTKNLKQNLKQGVATQGGVIPSVGDTVVSVGDNELIENQISQKKMKLEELLRKRKNVGSLLTFEGKSSQGKERLEEEEEVVEELKNYKVIMPTALSSSQVFTQDLQSKGSSLSNESLEVETFSKQEMKSHNLPLTEDSILIASDSASESEQEHEQVSLVTSSNFVSRLHENDKGKLTRSSELFHERSFSSTDKPMEPQLEPPEGTSDIVATEKDKIDNKTEPQIQPTTTMSEGHTAAASVVVLEDGVGNSDDHVDIRDDDDDDVVVDEDVDGSAQNLEMGNHSPDMSVWQGVNLVDGLDVLQGTFEAEQRDLQTEKSRQERMAATVSNEMYSESQELLRLFGIPYVVSPMEAEAQCAALDGLGLTHGSITNDSDIFLFGSSRVYKNFFDQDKHVELYQRESVERSLGLSRAKLVCIAFLTGSDYTEGVQGVGAVGAMEILNEFPGNDLEGLKSFKKWHNLAQKEVKPPQETKVKTKLRSLVLNSDFPSEEVYEAYMKPVVDESTEPFEWAKPDLHSLRLYALEKLGWPRSKTDEVLLPVLKQLNKHETQLKLEQFFPVQFQESRQIRSKRVKRVVNRLLSPDAVNAKNPDSSDNEKDKTTRRRKRKLSGATKTNQRKRTCSKKYLKQRESSEDNSIQGESNDINSELEQGKSTGIDKAAQTASVQVTSGRNAVKDAGLTSDDSDDNLRERTRIRQGKNKEEGQGHINTGQKDVKLAWKEEPVLNFNVLQTAADTLELRKDDLGLCGPCGSVASGNASEKKTVVEKSVGNVELRSKIRQCDSDSYSTSSDSSGSEDTASDMFTAVTRNPLVGVFRQSRSTCRGRGVRRDKKGGRGRGTSNLKNVEAEQVNV